MLLFLAAEFTMMIIMIMMCEGVCFVSVHVLLCEDF